MMVPAKGDMVNFPLTPEGRRVANAWDPAKDNAAGEQCRAYGAGGVTRMTGRLHITWQDDNTLKVDADTGTQTRLVHFGAAPRVLSRHGRGMSWARGNSPAPRAAAGGGAAAA